MTDHYTSRVMQLLSTEFLQNLALYGYYILFLLVFLQEVGVPSPLPNELLLLFSGYMAYCGKLNLFYAILSAFAGDVLGSAILFTLFYFFGKQIMKKKPRWIPVSEAKLNNLSTKLQKMGATGIFLGRLSPFIRGYVSVLSGLMNFQPRKYVLIMATTAPLWASFYIASGFLLGPYWKSVSHCIGSIPLYIGLVPLSLFVGYLIFQILRKYIGRSQQIQTF